MLSIIVPTLGNRIEELNRLFKSLSVQTNRSFEVILGVQGSFDIIEELASNYSFPIKILRLNKRGLSFARNQSIPLISADASVVTFSDDDCWYPEFFVERVLEKLGNGLSMVCFQIFDPVNNVPFANYRKEYNPDLSYRRILNISSIEIFIPKKILEAGILFDEAFGLGTSNPSGEENIFLFDLKRNGNKVIYIPEIIVYHLKPIWQEKEYTFKGKGKLFSRLYNKFLAFFMVFYYMFRKRKLSQKPYDDFIMILKEVVWK